MIIQAGNQKYQLGVKQRLSESEIEWLAIELSQWLGLKIKRTLSDREFIKWYFWKYLPIAQTNNSPLNLWDGRLARPLYSPGGVISIPVTPSGYRVQGSAVSLPKIIL